MGHDLGVMEIPPEGCLSVVPVEPVSWGAIKALYR
jgi:hypothetical protein